MDYKYISQDFFNSFYGENKQYKSKMISMFLDRAPKYMDDMQNFLNQESWIKLGGISHKFKSCVDFIGAIRLRDILAQIQDHSDKQDKLEILPELVEQFKNDCQGVLRELEIELSI